MAGRPDISTLLVEDDDADAKRVQVMLKRAEDVQFTVRRAVSLKSALQVIEVEPPDIVLLDLSLPDYQGYDTVVEYTRQSSVPFVVLTGNGEIQMAMRAVDLGAQDYVLKDEIAAKPLERALLVAVRRAVKEQVHRRLEMESREVLCDGDDSAIVSLLRPHLSRIMEAMEDLVHFIARNAPGLMDDVRAILDKHGVDVTIKELRDTLRMHADQGSKSKISERGMKKLDMIASKRTRPGIPASPSTSSDAILLDILDRRTGEGDG